MADLVREQVHRRGPISFEDFVEIALYAPDAGFYETGGQAGGHFLTSPSLGPLFGAVIARALDGWWRELGEPDPFVVVEAAAGTGMLARAVLAASPACAGALRYLLVERSETLRASQPVHVPLEPAANVLGRLEPGDEEDEDGPRVVPGGGPSFASLPDLPAGPFVGVVLANELLDNLPFVLLERGAEEWLEVCVDDQLREVLVPASPAVNAEADRLAPTASRGARIPVQHRAVGWVRDAVRLLQKGRVVVVDYAVAATAELAGRPTSEWIRTYRTGSRGLSPLEAAGGQDITCEVCVDQVARAAPLASDRTQAEFLAAWGLADLVDAARVEWEAGAAAATLDALKAKGRISEAEALTDPGGLGAFRVLEWVV